ncbi:glycoside hydrolase family 6 protein [Curtobacterium sp. MCBD17_030]|uniref:glycoside hydrolase family 6 protein n=1 Tax=Curtobacterium sp. MCBD17_030 TaxID=2175649 RepID=UPI0015E8DC85|nr:glycoside hydrolase family 6 protein [Curtobacterium sp. MCBD17_030]
MTVGLVASGLVLSESDSSPAAAATPTELRARTAAQVYRGGQYNPPTGEAAKAAAALRTTDPAGAAAASTIARYPVATWLGEWTQGTTLTETVTAATDGAAATGTTAVFVTYAIPQRDCGGYSAGGFDETSYDRWVDQVVSLVAGKRAVVVVEPDSLAMLSNSACTGSLDQQRYRILSREVAAFTAAGVPAYLDAGNSNWVPAATMADRLVQAGVQTARGFSTNVANYYPVAQEQAYAQRVSALTGGSHYVIDTSRNGTGWRGTWCNAPGAGLGTTPRVATDGTALDALLWVKTPGASDGTCNGGPRAGSWYSAYAQALVANAALGTPVLTPTPATRQPVAPRVALDSATTAPAGIAVRGWTVDADAPGASLPVGITVDGRTVATTTAGLDRPDVARATGAGAAHGFQTVVPGPAGTHRVCAVVSDVGPGGTSTTARTGPTSVCRTVTVAASAPVGRLDAATSPATRRVAVSGWAFDRDAVSTPVTVTVRIDGRHPTGVAASGSRPDVDRVYSAGSSHGYSRTLAVASGRHTVCVTATGLGRGGDASLGCRTVTVR